MLDDDFKLYCQRNIDLAKSIVIKCESAAKMINIHLESLGEKINYEDPTTWKYYINLSGDYFNGNSPYGNTSDTMIQVNSSEDGALIDFSKLSLATRPLTKASFSSYVDRLVETYPKQENLIYYIYKPIDMSTAISAENFQILDYDRSLVASNEVRLMDKVQQWVYNFSDRYFKEDFQFSDPYYIASFLATMYIHLPNAIMGFRHEACGSPEVDQYHLWNYLNDHYELGSYKDALSTRQALWLYRNMVDIQRNAGKEWVLENLIDVLATPKGLSCFKFDYIKEQSHDLLTSRGDGNFLKREFKDNKFDLDEQPIENPLSILYKTRDKALKNRKELEADQSELIENGIFEINEYLPVGLLEFELSSRSLAELSNDIKYRIEYWLYLSALNMYNSIYTFDIPNSGKVTLNTKEAFILYEYARFARSDIHLDKINSYYARNVVSFDPSISIADFRQCVPESYVSDDFINDTLADRIPNISVTGPASLEQYAEAIIRRKLKHKLSIDHLNTLNMRAHHINVIEGVYTNFKCILEPAGTVYDDWLADKKIGKFSMSKADWQTVMLDILFQCTGIDPENLGIGFSRSAMIEIIDRLTSYNVIVVNGTDGMLVEEMPFPFMYPDKTNSSKYREIMLDVADVRFIDHFSEKSYKSANIELDPMFVSLDPPKNKRIDLDVELPLGITYERIDMDGKVVSIPSINFIDK